MPERKMKHRRKTPDYQLRAVALRKLGFSSYREYLGSPLWARIRSAVLARDRVCRLCGVARSSQVHHHRYTVQVLRGNVGQLRFLIGVCGSCHRSVEFVGDDKRAPFEVSAETRRLLKAQKRSPRKGFREV